MLGAVAQGPGRATGAPSRAGGLPGDEQVSLSVGMRAKTPNHAQPCEHRCARAGQCDQNLPHRLRLGGTHICRTLSTSSEPSRPHCQNRKPQRARKWAFLQHSESPPWDAGRISTVAPLSLSLPTLLSTPPASLVLCPPPPGSAHSPPSPSLLSVPLHPGLATL